MFDVHLLHATEHLQLNMLVLVDCIAAASLATSCELEKLNRSSFQPGSKPEHRTLFRSPAGASAPDRGLGTWFHFDFLAAHVHRQTAFRLRLVACTAALA